MTDGSSNAYEPGPGVAGGSGRGPGPVVPGGRHAAHSPQAQFIPTTGSEAAGSAVRYKMTTWRMVCGLCWALWTTLFAVGAIAAVASGNVFGFLVGAVLAGLAGWYDYRIWSCQARRLTLFIIV